MRSIRISKPGPEALALLEKAAASSIDSLFAPLAGAVLTAQKGDKERALMMAEDLARDHPYDVEVLHAKGYLLSIAKRREQAVKCYAKVLEIDSNSEIALGNLAKAAIGLGVTGTALNASMYDGACAIRSNDRSPSRLIAALSPRNERFAADASTTDLARSRSR